jgi:pyruvate dehydrogenase E2 component (dihydrolipoamide acetyltransferase)
VTSHVFRLPDLGEGLAEAEILRWRVAVGDEVVVNQPIVEVETAKAAVEIPCPVAGTVSMLGADEGGVLAVGAPLIELVVRAEVGTGAGAGPEGHGDAVLVGYGPRAAGAPVRRPRRAAVPAQAPPLEQPATDTRRVSAKPPVRKLAKHLGIDLAAVPGSGPSGSVTRSDLEAFRSANAAPIPQPAVVPEGDRIPIRGVRRATAEAMVRSVAVPQSAVRLAVDVGRAVHLPQRLQARHPDVSPPSFLTLVARALVLALEVRPMLHARWDEAAGEIVVPSSVALGVAVAAPRGLLVPKVRDAGSLSLRALREAIDGVVAAGREGRLTPTDLTNGTITVSNVGVFGVDGGTALLTPGETAILCVGAVTERPWVQDGELVVRPVVELTLTIDHRVVDGAEAAGFLADVGALLHDPELMLARS